MAKRTACNAFQRPNDPKRTCHEQPKPRTLGSKGHIWAAFELAWEIKMISLSSENDSMYSSPAKLILAGLSTSLTDLRNSTVNVSTSFIKRLLVLLISDAKIDDAIIYQKISM
jgi:hypothetical protein